MKNQKYLQWSLYFVFILLITYGLYNSTIIFNDLKLTEDNLIQVFNKDLHWISRDGSFKISRIHPNILDSKLQLDIICNHVHNNYIVIIELTAKEIRFKNNSIQILIPTTEIITTYNSITRNPIRNSISNQYLIEFFTNRKLDYNLNSNLEHFSFLRNVELKPGLLGFQLIIFKYNLKNSLLIAIGIFGIVLTFIFLKF